VQKPEVHWFSNSIVDPVGRVGMVDSSVIRAIYDDHSARVYKEIIQSDWLSNLVDAGLVETKISEDMLIPDACILLEHQFIPFETHAAEHTDYMHWRSAEMTLKLSVELCKKDLFLKDAHPWNVMFYKGRPKFVDFSSITDQRVDIRRWLDEFYIYYAVPIWLASHKRNTLSRSYRIEHKKGFGIQLFSHKILKRLILGRVFKMVDKGFTQCEVIGELLNWLNSKYPHKPEKAVWSEYEQGHSSENPMKPATEKQQFVYNVLETMKPDTLLDCAANKGFYSEMAARFRCNVAAFDVDEFSVNECLIKAHEKDLLITPVVMDFMFPTSDYGLALSGRNAFERYRSDMVFGLGLIHHLCLREGMPLELFIRSLIRFSRSDIVLEYVGPQDKHVKTWGIHLPEDYSFIGLVNYFEHFGWTLTQTLDIYNSGLDRKMLHFQIKQFA
jgi:hypothetical protein